MGGATPAQAQLNIPRAVVQADKDGGRANQQESARAQGVHPGSGRLSPPCALPRIQADRGEPNTPSLVISCDHLSHTWPQNLPDLM